jgi:hypothetical protein
MLVSQVLCEGPSPGLIPEPLSADDLLPLLGHVVLEARVPNLPSELAFIEAFCTDDRLMGAEGYALRSVQVRTGSLKAIPRAPARVLIQIRSDLPRRKIA